MNLLAVFGNLGCPDGLFVLFIILLLFGAKRLPELARGLRLASSKFLKAKGDVDREASLLMPDHFRYGSGLDIFGFALALSIILSLILLIQSAVHIR